MATFRNDAKGARGIRLKRGGVVILDPGKCKVVAGHDIASMSAGITIVDPAEAEVVTEPAEELPPPPSSLSKFDHDGDGKDGGSKPHDPPALSAMNKAKLIEQAEAEGILIEHVKGTGANGNVIADDIRAAIEAKRASAS